MPREILVDWITNGHSGQRSVFYFGTGPAVSVQRNALHAFLTDVKAFITSSSSYTIETSGRELDPTTGMLLSTWGDSTAKTGVGGVAGESVPDASQLLVQWRTNSIIDGRFIRGRQFIPGLSIGNVTQGNVKASCISAITTSGATFVASSAELSVWHRPKARSGGALVLATACSVWQELAVLRRRRA